MNRKTRCWLTRTLEDEYGLPRLPAECGALAEGQYLPRMIYYAMFKAHALADCWQGIEDEVEDPHVAEMIGTIRMDMHHMMRALILYSSLDWVKRDRLARVLLNRWKFPRTKYVRRPWKLSYKKVIAYEVGYRNELEKAFEDLPYDDIIFPKRRTGRED